ncbi:MAG: hypothetical protein IJJ45_10985 [Clostridia bacterium]|nr:hypothetical protein [Clostridia bacterium]
MDVLIRTLLVAAIMLAALGFIVGAVLRHQIGGFIETVAREAREAEEQEELERQQRLQSNESKIDKTGA